jgi:hypothetical protein
MNEELSEQLSELRNAITEAVWKSERVANAMAALLRSARDVQIAIDATLADGAEDDSTAAVEDQGVSAGKLVLDETDGVFLQALKICDQ